MLPFLRSDLVQLIAYTPHPGGTSGSPVHPASDGSTPPIDRLDTNESPFDLPDELKQKLAWVIQQALESNRYPDGGHGGLKEAIAHYVNESASLASHPLTPDHISVGNGSDELIRSLLIATCSGRDGSILVAQPTFSMYGILAQTLGIPVVAVGRSEDTFEMDLDAAQRAIAHPPMPLRALFVVHPNSPTGNALTDAEVAWLRSIPDHILVVIDEAYFEFSQTTVVSELAQHPNWVILRTFSKALRLAAYRVGYAIAHPEVIATLEKIRLPYNLPSITQSVAQLALSHRPTLLEAIPILIAERNQLIHQLSAYPILRVYPSTANFIFVRLQAPHTSDATLTHIFETLRSQGTLVRKISGGLRITIGTPAENQRTLVHLGQLLTAL